LCFNYNEQLIVCIEKMKLKKLIDSNMTNFNILREICDRCLNTERWQGNVVLMVLDMAFTSVGVSYFNVVVPKIKIFRMNL